MNTIFLTLASVDSKYVKSSVIRQKGKSQSGFFKKTKHAIFPENEQIKETRRKKCSFFGKIGVLCFLETPVLRFVRFRLITDEMTTQEILWLHDYFNIEQVLTKPLFNLSKQV